MITQTSKINFSGEARRPAYGITTILIILPGSIWQKKLISGELRSSSMDLGFSAIVQMNPLTSKIHPQEISNKCLKRHESLKIHLQNKYLLCLEGNDTASGLKWMLSSKSLVLMPTPTVQTWACESLMKPFVHYVPVRRDLENLEETLDWCRSNELECRQIVYNANSFMKPEIEDFLACEVVRRCHQAMEQ